VTTTATDLSGAAEEQASKGTVDDEDDGSWFSYFKPLMHTIAMSQVPPGMHGHPAMHQMYHGLYEEQLRRQAEYTPWGGFSTPVLEGIAIAVLMVAFIGGALAVIVWADYDDGKSVVAVSDANAKKTDGDGEEVISEVEALRLATNMAQSSFCRF